MTTATKDIFVEITSGESIEICKEVMEELLKEMINANLTSRQQTSDSDQLAQKTENLDINIDSNAAGEKMNLRNTMIIQQVKTMDSKGNLKTVYPSRVDLNFTDSPSKIKVVRLYDD